ncbi:MAG: hypothetical protein ACK4PR_13010, partial [Gammaproteobacteria bacterium]
MCNEQGSCWAFSWLKSAFVYLSFNLRPKEKGEDMQKQPWRTNSFFANLVLVPMLVFSVNAMAFNVFGNDVQVNQQVY